MKTKTKPETHHPIQPTEVDSHGTLRFKRNAIVEHLLEVGSKHGASLNDLACMSFSAEDWQQVAQLIGYSLSGYSSLSYVDDEAFGAAQKMADEGLSEDKARITHLEGELKAVRKALREPMARLFSVHPDDLKG